MEMEATFTDQFAFQVIWALNLILGVTTVQSLLERGNEGVQRRAARWASQKNESDDTIDNE